MRWFPFGARQTATPPVPLDPTSGHVLALDVQPVLIWGAERNVCCLLWPRPALENFTNNKVVPCVSEKMDYVHVREECWHGGSFLSPKIN